MSNRLIECTWKEIRDDIAKVNKKLADIIDKIDPDDSYTVFRRKYRYGEYILRDSDFLVTNKLGQSVPISDASVDAKIQEKLGYNLNSNPVMLLLDNSIELFLKLQNRTIPFSVYGMISKGHVFGLGRLFNNGEHYHPAFLWNMTAGARSIFMLPKISSSLLHKKLSKQLCIHEDTPKNLLDHWHVFKKIANHKEFGEPWFTEIVFFSKKWFETLDDPAWKELKIYLLEAAWQRSSFWRDQFIWDTIFSMIQGANVIRANPYIADNVKTLILIGLGKVPGFSPAEDDDIAPISRIQKAYLDIYGLKKYPPIIMQPKFLQFGEKSDSVYYSLEYPMAIEFSPKLSQNSSKLDDLLFIRRLLDTYIREISANKLNVANTRIFEIIKKIKFDCYHCDVSQYSGLKESAEIYNDDKKVQGISKQFSRLEFPERSPFFRGCVRVST